MPRECYCGLRIRPNGTCENTCSRWAEPGHLRAQHSKRLARDAHASREDHWTITVEERKRMDAAIARFDPWFRRARKQAAHAAATRYALGGKRS